VPRAYYVVYNQNIFWYKPLCTNFTIVLEDVNQPFSIQDSVHRAYYGVYDGHGGTYAADMTADLLHRHIIQDPAFASGNIEEAIKNGFDKTDRIILEKAEKEKWSHGTTAVVGIIIDNALYIANTGDSGMISIIIKKRRERCYKKQVLQDGQRSGPTVVE
jgi:protein phosphatase 2C family protein 2/3